MDRRLRVVYLLISGVLFVALIWALRLDVGFDRPEDLWLQILVYLIIAALLFEPQFSGAVPATMNAIAVAVFALGTGLQDLPTWWWMIFSLAITTLILLLFAYAVEESTAGRGTPLQSTAAEAKRLGRLIGSWRFLLVGALLLALLTTQPPESGEWSVAAILVLFVVTVTQWKPHEALSRLFSDGKVGQVILPLVARPPVELLVRAGPSSPLEIGTALLLSAGPRQARGLVVSAATLEGRGAWRIFTPELQDLLQVSSVDDLKVMIPAEAPPDQDPLQHELHAGSVPLGVIRERSQVDILRIDLHPEASVSVGQIVWTVDDGLRTYWQTTGAEISTSGWTGDTRRVVVAECNQLGTWKPDTLRFESRVTSPPLTGLVLGSDQIEPEAGETPPNAMIVGTLPGSSFPVIVDLRKLSLQHSAILGTTGTGKTHLAFALLAELSQLGTRVICYDSTGQYRQRFNDAEVVAANEVEDFVAEPGGGVAILESGTNMIIEGNQLARRVFNWARTEGLSPDPERPAPCLIALEEAQNVIPEAFVVNDWDLKARAQDTSQVIMESRKLGLGFMIISQRTAMVTKSALSQCNTLFAFQAVDQTGLDYFEGLCGSAMAKSIPTLKHRTAIAMGTGTTSDRPMIFYVGDADVVVG